MSIKNLDIYVCGDIHGNFSYLLHLIKTFHITNAVIILAGDVGFGFNKYAYYEQYYNSKMHKILEDTNVYILAVRGNHDDPKYYSSYLINFPHLKTVADYDILELKGHNILCIGGATSVDKEKRIEDDFKSKLYGSDRRTWWEDEDPYVDEYTLTQGDYDIIVSHCAPMLTYPIVTWGGELNDRRIMNKIYDLARDKVKAWYYGHYHDSNCIELGGTVFHLLGINEIKAVY